MSSSLMKKKEATCYMCDAPSVGRDHVPPRCLFPIDSQFRKSLVSVPSCAKHNAEKSTDDELLRWVLTAINANNEIAQKVLSEAVLPSLAKKPKLAPTFLRGALLRVSESEGPKMIVKLDVDRFKNSLEAIARGLYYHHTWYTHKALGTMEVAWESAKAWPDAVKALNLSDKDYVAITRPSSSQPKCPLGENPKVFRYGFDFYSDPKTVFCYLRFYEGDAIVVRWDNGKIMHEIRLKSLVAFIKSYKEVHVGAAIIWSVTEKIDLMRRLEEQHTWLIVIMKEAKHKREFGAFLLARKLRDEIAKKKRQLNGESSIS
jgi:hypothetical protein